MNDNKELISIFTVTFAFYLANQACVLKIVCSYRSSKDLTLSINFASINRMKAPQPHDPFLLYSFSVKTLIGINVTWLVRNLEKDECLL